VKKPEATKTPAKTKVEPMRRITWTSRKEVWITTAMVMIMVVVASLFLWLVDIFFGWLLSLLQTGLHG